MIDFDELALKLAKAEADNVVLKQTLDKYKEALEHIAHIAYLLNDPRAYTKLEIDANVTACEALGIQNIIEKYKAQNATENVQLNITVQRL